MINLMGQKRIWRLGVGTAALGIMSLLH